jgi:hypothetical protein
MVLLNIKTCLIFTQKYVELLSKAFGYKKYKVTGTLQMWYKKYKVTGTLQVWYKKYKVTGTLQVWYDE